MENHKFKLTILVVDDEFIFRELNKKRIIAFLESKANYEILTAGGFEKALEIIKTKHIDVVFTDMQMGDRIDCGLILARKIRLLNPNINVFIVSNANLEFIKEKAISAGATGSFQLPLKNSDLKSAFFGLI